MASNAVPFEQTELEDVQGYQSSLLARMHQIEVSLAPTDENQADKVRLKTWLELLRNLDHKLTQFEHGS